jgi:hypothetical protein
MGGIADCVKGTRVRRDEYFNQQSDFGNQQFPEPKN